MQKGKSPVLVNGRALRQSTCLQGTGTGLLGPLFTVAASPHIWLLLARHIQFQDSAEQKSEIKGVVPYCCGAHVLHQE